MPSKIQNLRNLWTIVRKLKAQNKTIVQCHGVFDLLHWGHIHYFKQAKKYGDILVVSVVDDKFVDKGPGRPVFDQKIRLQWLAALEDVDYAVLCGGRGPWKVIKSVKPDFYAKGEDSKPKLADPKNELWKDKATVEAAGGKFIFTKSLPIHSTDLLKKPGFLPTK